MVYRASGMVGWLVQDHRGSQFPILHSMMSLIACDQPWDYLHERNWHGFHFLSELIFQNSGLSFFFFFSEEPIVTHLQAHSCMLTEQNTLNSKFYY